MYCQLLQSPLTPEPPSSRGWCILPYGTQKWPCVTCFGQWNMGGTSFLDRFMSWIMVLHVSLLPALGPVVPQMDAACLSGLWNKGEMGAICYWRVIGPLLTDTGGTLVFPKPWWSDGRYLPPNPHSDPSSLLDPWETSSPRRESECPTLPNLLVER